MADHDPTQPYQVPPPPEAPPAPVPADASPEAPPAPAAPAGSPARRRLPWIVAIVVAALVIGGAAAGTLLLTGDAGDPDVLAWTPADRVVYAELRLDLPGDQQAELAKVMQAFPGFDDQATFAGKLSEGLDQLVRRASDGKQGYQADIEPWFGGQVAVSAGPLPRDPEDASSARLLLLASVKDGQKAAAWAEGLLAEEGASTSTESHGGVTITVVELTGDEDAGMARPDPAYAVLGPVIALGDLASVKAAIDTRGSAGLATTDTFRQASATLTGDRLGFYYADTAAIMEASRAMARDGGVATFQLPAFLDRLTVPWTVGTLRAQDGALVLDARSPHVDAMGPARNAESALPGLLPASTVFLAEGHDVGEALRRFRDLAASDPELADGLRELEGALALVGGFEAAVGWMGEVGVAVTRDGDRVGGGLLVTPTDRAAAERLLTQLKGFLLLGGAQAGITVTEETHAGTPVTVIDLGALAGLAGGATGGLVEGVDDLELAYAVVDEVVVLGIGTEFVTGVLDVRGGQASLAASERFAADLARAGAQHAGLTWLDVRAIRELVESLAPADERAEYDADVRPYLAPFDTIIITNTLGEPLDTGTMIVRVSGS